MRGMILAAGRGQRMGELTTHIPKPLLRVAGNYLIDYAIASLRAAGIYEIVINISHHKEQIKQAIGDGKRYGVTIYYSEEEERLETGGGIAKALPLLGNEPFLVMSSDIITDYPLQQLPQNLKGLAHLVMVDNPSFHPNGDFGLRQGYADLRAKPTYTFGNIGVYHPALFKNCDAQFFPLNQLLFPAIEKGQITAEYFQGMWFNVGTKEDLTAVNERAREDSNLRPLASETNTLSS